MTTKDVTVSKRLPDEPEARKAIFQHSFPDSTAEAVERYGESLTHKLICDSITLLLQGPARKVLETAPPGQTEAQYSEYVNGHMADYKVEIKRTRGSSGPKVNAYQQIAQDLTNPAKRDEILARFRSLGINLEVGVNGDTSNDPIPLEAPEEEEEESTPSRRRR